MDGINPRNWTVVGLSEVKEGRPSRRWNASHLSSPQSGKIQSARLLRPDLKACAGRQSCPKRSLQYEAMMFLHRHVGFGTKDGEEQRDTELCNFGHNERASWTDFNSNMKGWAPHNKSRWIWRKQFRRRKSIPVIFNRLPSGNGTL